ncbi:MAG: Crp/Fnr family transcriptional regulator [Bacteroidetes bacterium]|jgi:CRP-like cAMP-binding protein|nr:Crp/Fnr family transcriptional regulator [Bacteroidota bacterium]
MDAIRTFLGRFATLSTQEWRTFEQLVTRIEVKKGEPILMAGEACRFLAFIERGCFRMYAEEEGREQVLEFFFPGETATNYRSFLTEDPSAHYISAIQPSTIYILTKTNLQTLYQAHPKFERVGRLVAEAIYLRITRKIDLLQNYTPEQRYSLLMAQNRELVQQVPQYMIASYLGIQPETLSRIKKRMTPKKPD